MLQLCFIKNNNKKNLFFFTAQDLFFFLVPREKDASGLSGVSMTECVCSSVPAGSHRSSC